MPAENPTPRLSVVCATYNRPDLAIRLLGFLGAQSLRPDEVEIIVVDDGSAGDAASRIQKVAMPFPFRVLTQRNSGPAVARHRGIEDARGEIIVLLDDDMQMGPDFLAAHRACHEPGTRRVVLGHIQPDPGLAMPLFERYHAAMILRFIAEARSGRLRLRGTQLCTGNVSFRRADYLAVGGFDSELGQSEDAELGVRLEKAGVELVFGDAAVTLHASVHSSLPAWIRRSFRYGIFDLRIARKHRDASWTHPWRYLFLVHPLSRSLLLTVPLFPALGRAAGRAVMGVAMLVDRLGLERLAISGTTLAYGLLYFSGVRTECGSLRGALRELRIHLADRRRESRSFATLHAPDRPR